MQWARRRIGGSENLIQPLSVCGLGIPNFDEKTFLLLLPHLKMLLPLDYPPTVGQVKTSTLGFPITAGHLEDYLLAIIWKHLNAEHGSVTLLTTGRSQSYHTGECDLRVVMMALETGPPRPGQGRQVQCCRLNNVQ